MKIVAVIPTFNRKDYLKVLLDQLSRQNLENISLETVVVVDGSTDGTLEMLAVDFPKVHVVKGDGNWWYTKSMNEGFSYATKLTPDYILTLNDDIEINKNFLQTLTYASHRVEKNSIVGSASVTIEKPHLITSGGVKDIKVISGKTITYFKFGEEVCLNDLSGLYPTKTLPGRGMLIPTTILNELDYFDIYFKQYLSDHDFCLRASAVGYNIYITLDAIVFSHVNLTSSSSSFKKSTFFSFFNSFFLPHSRNHILQRTRFLWRHRVKALVPISLIIWLLAITRANLWKKKM